ncbi:MAG: hypothetical protein RLZZ501_2025 [Pseudomonadota bacterium]|jgi:LPS-assembly lipoprotein
MSWPRLLLLGVALAGLGPAGCGFRAIHAVPGPEEVSADGRGEARGAAELARIRIDPIADRTGQLVRNALLQRLSPRGEPADPLYTLTVRLTENYSDLGYRRDSYSTLSNLTLTATFTLSGEDLLLVSDTASTIVSFDSLGARYASVVMERDARDRAAVQIADDLRSRVAAALERYHAHPDDPIYRRNQGTVVPQAPSAARP